MLWSNWQGAILRGAVLAFLFWAGLAWTQSPTKNSAGSTTERIMVVHENGKATRCRVLESWQLPDGRMANLLQAVETGELITIVDDRASRPGLLRDTTAMPKRIFGWGKGRRTPPDGSPIPPQMRIDSGVVVKSELPMPKDGVVMSTPGVTIVNQAVDNKALGEKYGERFEGKPVLPRSDTPAKSNGGLLPRLFPKRENVANNPQVLEFAPGSQTVKSTPASLPPSAKDAPTMGQTVTFPPTTSNGWSSPGSTTNASNAGSTPPQIVNNQAGNNQRKPLLTRVNPFAPRETIEVVPQVNEANAFGPAIVQGMETNTQKNRPQLGGLWRTPNATPPNLTAGGQPLLPTTPNLGAPIGNNPPLTKPLGIPSPAAPLVFNGNEQPELPTTPGNPPARTVPPALGGLWKTPAASAEKTPPSFGTPVPSAGTPGQLPNSPPRIVNENPAVPANPVVVGATPPKTRPIFGGLFGTPKATASNPTPGASNQPTKHFGPVATGVLNPPYATGSNTPGASGQTPAPASGTPGQLPNASGVAQQTPATGLPTTNSRPIIGGIWKKPNESPANPTASKEPIPTVPKATGDSTEKPAVAATPKPWRPGDRIAALFRPAPAPSAPKPETVKTETSPFGNSGKPASANPKSEIAKKDPAPISDTSKPMTAFSMQRAAELLEKQNKLLEKQMQANAEKVYKVPFSTAMSAAHVPPPASAKTPKEETPLAIPAAKLPPDPVHPVAPVANDRRIEKPEMFGKNEKPVVVLPGQSLLEPIKTHDVAKLTPPTAVNATLMSPERFNPLDKNVKTVGATFGTPKTVAAGQTPKGSPDAQKAPPAMPGGPLEPNAGPSWPIGAQSVLAAKSGLVGPVTYVPIPTVTVPAPHNPPVPPEPQMPSAPQLNMHVNGFSPPPVPRGAQQYVGNQMPMANPMMNPYANPLWAQQMMQHQAMLQQQQYAWLQQQQQYAMMQQYGYRPNPYMQASYTNTAPSAGPMTNPGRFYAGPMPPSAMQQPMAPAFYPPPPPQPPMIQNVSYQQPAMPTQQSVMTQQVEQIIKVLRESPYPSQRESAAQSLTSFEWRAHPQIIPALVQSARQDPAPNVRAGCVNSLGRMKAAVEPVFGALQALRSDIDPRVRQEVEGAFTSLGQAPMMPGYR